MSSEKTEKKTKTKKSAPKKAAAKSTEEKTASVNEAKKKLTLNFANKVTKSIKASEVKKSWLLVDATDQAVGRLASQIAYMLRGKHKPTFTPNVDCGDNIVVVNCEKVKFTGAKWTDKFYHTHSLFIGGIKSTSAEKMRDTHPERILKIAVKGMLPKNKLSKQIINNLKIYKGAEHPHQAQNPQPPKARLVKGE